MRIDLVWSQAARENLLDIYVAIGLSSPSAAERIYDRIETRAQQLAGQPRVDPRRPDIRPGTRILVVAPYLILYAVDPDTDAGPVQRVGIVSVVDGRRDLRTGA